MSLRRKLVLSLCLTTTAMAALTAWLAWIAIGRVFGELDRIRTAAVLTQFDALCSDSAEQTGAAMSRLAGDEVLRRMASEPGGSADADNDAAALSMAAGQLARQNGLDFLEVVSGNGTVLSSAQWPARFGSRESLPARPGSAVFLMQEEMPDGDTQVGLFTVRAVRGAVEPVELIGGRRLTLNLLRCPPGTQVRLYRNLSATFDAHNFAGSVPGGDRYQAVVDRVRGSGREGTGVVEPTGRRQESVEATAIPLRGLDGQAPAVLVVANSRRGLVEAQNRIVAAACGVGGLGIVLAVAIGWWTMAAMTRPIRQVTAAAGEAAAGDWGARAEVRPRDDPEGLAHSFNRALRGLTAQRDRLLQSERAAAWRELAGPFAGEVERPLLRLQMAAESMMRARYLPRVQFDEVFEESAATLRAEIENLRRVTESLAGFAKPSEAQREAVDVRDVVRDVLAVHTAVLEERRIDVGLSIGAEPAVIAGAPETLRRALSALVLYAMEAMPEGGTLTAAAARVLETARISIASSGARLSAEECERLFLPDSGAGLSLALVQAVVADHRGVIRAECPDEGGVRFVLSLPVEQRLLAAPGNQG